MSLPPVEPDVAADVLAVLPRRVAARVEVLVAEAEGWAVDRDGDTVTVTLGGEHVRLIVRGSTVRAADDVTCSCLLAPRCAHRGAVARAAPLATAAEPEESDLGPAVVSREPARPTAATRLESARLAAPT